MRDRREIGSGTETPCAVARRDNDSPDTGLRVHVVSMSSQDMPTRVWPILGGQKCQPASVAQTTHRLRNLELTFQRTTHVERRRVPRPSSVVSWNITASALRALAARRVSHACGPRALSLSAPREIERPVTIRILSSLHETRRHCTRHDSGSTDALAAALPGASAFGPPGCGMSAGCCCVSLSCASAVESRLRTSTTLGSSS